MKHIFTLTSLFFLLTNAFAQERVNGVKPAFTAESGKLTSATGWAFNSDDQDWVDYPNMITEYKSYKGKLKKLLKSSPGYVMSSFPQNLVSMQTKEFNYKDVTYYVLIVEKWAGEYKYPNLHEGYHQFVKTVACVFTDEEYKKLVNMDKSADIKTNIVITSDSHDIPDDVLIGKIKEKIDSSFYSSYYHTFPVLRSTEGKIRFFVPEEFSSYRNYDFEKSYFETEPDNFNKIILK